MTKVSDTVMDHGKSIHNSIRLYQKEWCKAHALQQYLKTMLRY
nr:MAG TPA: hypothetical protein [Caudoviricetes sp.]